MVLVVTALSKNWGGGTSLRMWCFCFLQRWHPLDMLFEFSSSAVVEFLSVGNFSLHPAQVLGRPMFWGNLFVTLPETNREKHLKMNG